jgi:manganese transport system substrate-binding protein
VPKPSLAVVLGVAAAVATAACAPSSGAGTVPGAAGAPDDRPRVVATFTVLADMVAVVGGDDVVVTSVTKPGSEIHGYEPTPDDLRRAAGADLLVVNGLGLENWIQRLVEPLGLPTAVLTDGIAPVRVAGSDAVNPHAWMSPRVGRHYVARIAAELASLDPARAAVYHERAAGYGAELDVLHGELVDRLASLPEDRRVLVTCEGAFSYLARDAGLEEAYLWPVNAERQGTPRQVADVVLTVRDRRVPAVFCESTVPPTAQQQVAAETGARFGGTLYVDSLTGPDGPAPTYLDLLRHDVEVIVGGLTGGPA